MKTRVLFGVASLAGMIFAGCARDDMWYQKKVETYEASDFFEDGIGTRLPVEGTVQYDSVKSDTLMYEGTENGAVATRFPFVVDKERLEHGRDRYGHFCSPCHGATGDGLGMIVRRGYKQPLAFSSPELMAVTPGYMFQVLRLGYSAANGGTKKSGINTSLGTQDYVHPPLLKKMGAESVWSAVAYIRALQKSSNVSIEELSPEEADKVKNPAASESNEGAENGGH
jgi:hypothetical protein